MPTIPQLPDASSVDFTDDATIILNNSSNEALEATLLQLKEAYLGNLNVARVTIPTASVLTLNATPVEIVAAPGAGKYILVEGAGVSIDFNSAAYTTNTALQLQISGGADDVGAIGNNILAATVSVVTNSFTPSNPSSGQSQIIENAALVVTNTAGDPATGDSDIDVFVFYRILEL